MRTKVHIVKAMVSLVVMYGCESLTIKKAEHWRIDAFELWCCRRLKSPLDCKEIKPVNPKGNQPWVFLRRTDAEGPMLWLPVAEESHHWERPWYWERLKAKGEGKMYYLHRMRWLSSITKSFNKYELEQTPETMEFCVLQSIWLQIQTWLSDRKTPSMFCSPTVFQNSFFVNYSLEDITKEL